LLVTVLTSSVSVLAQSTIQRDQRHSIDVDIGYCVDVDSNLNIEQALGCTFLPKKDLPRGKFADATYWIRIHANQHQNSSLQAIRIGPHFVGKIELFEQVQGVWQTQIAVNNSLASDAHAALGGYFRSISAK